MDFRHLHLIERMSAHCCWLSSRPPHRQAHRQGRLMAAAAELKACITCEVAQPASEYHSSKAKTRTECNTCRNFYNRLKHYGSHKNSAGRRVIKLADGSEVLLVEAVRGLRLRGYTYTARPRQKQKPDITDDKAALILDALQQQNIQITKPTTTTQGDTND